MLPHLTVGTITIWSVSYAGPQITHALSWSEASEATTWSCSGEWEGSICSERGMSVSGTTRERSYSQATDCSHI